MGSLRAYFLRHRMQALALVILALCLKAILPAGYMIGQGQHVLVIQMCHDGAAEPSISRVAVLLDKGPDHRPAKAAGDECPYGALSMASIGGGDPFLLGIAVAFLLLLGFAPTPPPALPQSGHLRPPLRGPPA